MGGRIHQSVRHNMQCSQNPRDLTRNSERRSIDVVMQAMIHHNAVDILYPILDIVIGAAESQLNTADR